MTADQKIAEKSVINAGAAFERALNAALVHNPAAPERLIFNSGISCSSGISGISGQSKGWPEKLLTCLSGGADSTALALLAQSYAARRGIAHRCLLVNHNIRRNAADEAARVAARMRQHGVEVEILTLANPAPLSGLQEWARRERYAALTEIARREGAILLLGHHRDDQAETVMMRLCRGSGIAGLAGMRVLQRRNGAVLVRPLLALCRQDLEDVCRTAGVDFENDPSNADARFERVRVRGELSRIAPENNQLSSQLVQLAETAAAIDDTLLAALERAGIAGSFTLSGAARLPKSVMQLPELIRNRALVRVILGVGGMPYPPSQAALNRLSKRLLAGQAATLGGCRFLRESMPPPQDSLKITNQEARIDENSWLVVAETGRRPPIQKVAPRRLVVFAGRWLVWVPVGGKLRNFGALKGSADRAWQDASGWAGLPAAVRAGLPVLETLDGGRFYPHIIYNKMAVQKAASMTAAFLPLYDAFTGLSSPSSKQGAARNKC